MSVLDFVKVFSPFAAVLLVYFLGLNAFHRQKQYELFRLRYLDEGIDRIATDAEHVLQTFLQNWTQAMYLLKQFRELGTEEAVWVGENAFSQTIDIRLPILAFYRLMALTGSDVFWRVYQRMTVFVSEANRVFSHELYGEIRLFARQKGRVERDVFIKAFSDDAQRRFAESRRYYALVHALQRLGTILEQERFQPQAIRSVHLRTEVRAIVDELETQFPAGSPETAPPE